MSRRYRADYLGLVEIRLPRPIAAIRRAMRRAYLRTLIASADADAQRHDWHAQREPQLAELARNRAQELRVELATLEPKGSQ